MDLTLDFSIARIKEINGKLAIKIYDHSIALILFQFMLIGNPSYLSSSRQYTFINPSEFQALQQ